MAGADVKVRCLVYTRQSVGRTGETEESSLSLNAQLDRIRSHCAREGWEIVETIQDHDLSGERWDRPGIQQLMDRVRAGGIDRVVVFSVSRIARKVLHQEMVMDVLTEHGVQLVSVTEAGLDNILVRVVHAGMAEQHNVNHRKMIRATLESRAKRGLHHGPAPFGYSLSDVNGVKGLEIIPEQAEIVQEMYRRRADGESVTAIARWLMAEGVSTNKTATWAHRTVILLLRNPVYAGYAVYHQQIVGDAVNMEAIIDRPLWEQVQRTFVKGKRHRRPKELRRSWLDGLVVHGCGSPMGSYYRGDAVDFRCNRYFHEIERDPNDVPMTLVAVAMERAALMCLGNDLARIPDDPGTVVRARADALGVPSAVKQREKLERQRAGLREQIARAEQLVTSGRRDFVWFDAFDQDAQERIAVLDAELATLSDIPTVEDVERRMDVIARLVPTLTLLELFPDSARALLAAIGQVRYHHGVVSIVYAPEFRDLFPAPHRVAVRYNRPVKEWVYTDCC